MAIDDDVRELNTELAKLRSENHSLKIAVAAWEAHANTLQTRLDIAEADSKRYIRDASELSTLLEHLMHSLMGSLKRFRANQMQQGKPDSHIRTVFIEDLDRARETKAQHMRATNGVREPDEAMQPVSVDKREDIIAGRTPLPVNNMSPTRLPPSPHTARRTNQRDDY